MKATTNKRSLILTNYVAPVGLLLVLCATVCPFFLRDYAPAVQAYPYVYCLGTAILLAARIFAPYRGDDFRLRRLHRLEAWVGIIFAVGAFFLFYQHGVLRDWLAFTLAGAAVQIFTSIAIPMREAKLSRSNH